MANHSKRGITNTTVLLRSFIIPIWHLPRCNGGWKTLIDPHTAVAIEAVDKINEKLYGETLILSTAHPAKFPKIIEDANLELLDIPKTLSDVYNLDEKASHMPASKELIFNFIIKNNL